MTVSTEPLRDFFLVFLPLLVAMNPLGTLPFLIPILGSIPREKHHRVVLTTLVTGLVVGLLFLGLGRGLFSVLSIEVSDFLIAGGLILLVLSLRELLPASRFDRPVEPDELTAIVPIGVPLLVGPATISMLILLSEPYNIWLVASAFLANLLLDWVVFLQSGRIARVVGTGGLQAFSKVAYLLLAAIAVQLIRKGVVEVVEGLD